MFCKQCGSEILNDSQFCENCGTKVERPAAPGAAPAASAPAPEFQAIPVNPVYPPNSIYAANAYAAQHAQPVMVQPIVNAPVQPRILYQQQYAQQGLVQPQAYVTPVPQYQAPVYYQPAVNQVYGDTGNPMFKKVLKIISIVAIVVYGLAFLVYAGGAFLGEAGNASTAFMTLLFAGFSVFVLIYTGVKKSIGKGAFIAFLISLCVSLYFFLNVVTAF